MGKDLVPLTYTDQHGEQKTTTLVRGKQMPKRVETFCRLMAAGDHSPMDAYMEAYGKEKTTNLQMLSIYSEEALHILGRSDVVLRIQQLRTPVVLEVAKKYAYSIDIAMHNLQIAWDLAFAKGRIPEMVKIEELRAKLHKLLSEQIDVNHRHGFLDDASTNTLMEVVKQLEAAKRKKLESTVTVEAKEVT